MSCGAMIVSFLLLAGMVPGSTNCLQVIDEIHEMRSPSSVSGFKFSFTIRLPVGSFLHELYSTSPAVAKLSLRRAAGATMLRASAGGAARAIPRGDPINTNEPITPVTIGRPCLLNMVSDCAMPTPTTDDGDVTARW